MNLEICEKVGLKYHFYLVSFALFGLLVFLLLYLGFRLLVTTNKETAQGERIPEIGRMDYPSQFAYLFLVCSTYLSIALQGLQNHFDFIFS